MYAGANERERVIGKKLLWRYQKDHVKTTFVSPLTLCGYHRKKMAVPQRLQTNLFDRTLRSCHAGIQARLRSVIICGVRSRHVRVHATFVLQLRRVARGSRFVTEDAEVSRTSIVYVSFVNESIQRFKESTRESCDLCSSFL